MGLSPPPPPSARPQSSLGSSSATRPLVPLVSGRQQYADRTEAGDPPGRWRRPPHHSEGLGFGQELLVCLIDGPGLMPQ